jgi:DNA-binding beta-propeller fold protein YncE
MFSLATVLGSLLLAPGLAAQPAAFVVNSLGETLTRIDPETGAVEQNILTLGSDVQSAPNHLAVLGDIGYAVISNTAEIQIIDLGGGSTIGFVDLPPGSSPYWMEIYDNTTAFVSLLSNNSVARVDLAAREVVDEIAVGKSPEGLAIWDHKLYVANTGFDFGTFSYDPGTVSVIDTRTGTYLYDIPVGINPQYMAMDRSGHLHVVCTGDFFSIAGEVFLVDTRADTVTGNIPLGGTPAQIAVTPDDRAFVAAGGWADSGHVYSYDVVSGEVFHDAGNPILIGMGCMGVTAYQDGTVFASTFGDLVYRLNSEGERQTVYAAGDGPVFVGFHYTPGNADGAVEGVVDVGDVLAVAAAVFLGGDKLPYAWWRGNVDGDHLIDVSDILHLAAYVFLGGPSPLPSANWPWP